MRPLILPPNQFHRFYKGGARIDGEPAKEDVTIRPTCDVRISAGRKKHGILTP